MSDKEPRRRKKRKDSQSRKDDIRSDDQIFMTSKSETKDSDPEVEEEIVVPTCQPSSFAKFVFVILFSGLIVSMSFIFISLHGTDKDASIDIFDEHLEEQHTEELDLSHDDSHGDSHEDDHDESESWSLKDGIQEKIEELLPGIGRILSFNDEQVDESDRVTSEETVDTLKDVEDEQTYEMTEESSTIAYDTSTLPSSTEELEDTDQPEEYIDSPKIYIETSTVPYEDQDDEEPEDSTYEATSNPQEFELVSEDEELEHTSPHTLDQSEFTTESPDITPSTESESYYDDSLDEVSAPSISTSSDVYDEDTFAEPEPEIREEETFPYYEKADITNEDDFGIRKELEELEADLEKEFPDDDDDDYEGEEGTEDEFEFWQF